MKKSNSEKPKNRTQKFAVIFAAVILVLVVAVYAVSTATTVRFNIATLVSYTLTLPGQGAVSGGADTATPDINFNISNATYYNVEASVNGGTVQSNGVPIFTFDNTGNVNLNLSVRMNMSLPACITLWGNTTWAGADTGQPITNTTNASVVTVYTPIAATQPWYMKADFVNCMTNDSQTNMIRSVGVQS